MRRAGRADAVGRIMTGPLVISPCPPYSAEPIAATAPVPEPPVSPSPHLSLDPERDPALRGGGGTPLRTELRGLRRAVDLTQDALARRVGLSRQALGAIERGEAVPSVEVALRLAGALEVPVERLFRLEGGEGGGAREAALGRLGRGRRVRRVTIGGQTTLVPAEGTGGAGPEPASGILGAGPDSRDSRKGAGGGQGADGTGERPDRTGHGPDRTGEGPSLLPLPLAPGSPLVLVGCDPATTLLRAFLSREAGVELLWLPRGSRAALAALAEGQAHVAGFHLRADPKGGEPPPGPTGSGDLAFPCTRIAFAVWEQGILLGPGNPLGIERPEDLARPDLRFVNREPGSGSRALLDRLLREAGVEGGEIPGYRETAAAGHWAVAQAVAAGVAHAGVGIRAAARAFDLAWIPLEEERYDLVIPDHLLDDPAVGALLDLLGSASLRGQVESLGGYDVSPMGHPV